MDTDENEVFEQGDLDAFDSDLMDARFDRAKLLKGALAAGLLAGLPVPSAFGAPGVKRGGTLRLGILGSSREAFDPHAQRSLSDLIRNGQIFEALVQVKGPKITPQLATSWKPNTKGSLGYGSQWTVKLNPNARFSNGKAVTADDVLWSYQRVQTKGRGRALISVIDVSKSKKIDNRTILFQLTQRYSLFANGPLGAVPIVPNGQDTFTDTNLVGTGPFKLTQATPGQSATFVRNTNYRMKGLPYLAGIRMIYFSDPTARLNALLAGQIDAIDSIQPSQVASAKRRGFKILTAKGGVWNPLVMDVKQEPFTDNRVRMAFKLIANRPLMVRNALGGFGEVGNDIFTNPAFDPDYNTSLPQRKQNIAQAKALLRAAGKSNLTVTLHTSDVALGLNAASLIFAQEASKAGVTVNVHQWPTDTYYSDPYLKEAFYVSNWSTKTLDNQSLQCVEGGFLETHWADPRFVALMQAARKTFVSKVRGKFYKEADKILRDKGGYIVWGFQDSLDAASPKFKGFVTVPGREFGGYDFRKVHAV